MLANNFYVIHALYKSNCELLPVIICFPIPFTTYDSIYYNPNLAYLMYTI